MGITPSILQKGASSSPNCFSFFQLSAGGNSFDRDRESVCGGSAGIRTDEGIPERGSDVWVRAQYFIIIDYKVRNVYNDNYSEQRKSEQKKHRRGNFANDALNTENGGK